MKNKYYQISIPGKTFLSGEYLALFGGSSLLVSTEPGFQAFFLPQTVTSDVALSFLEKKQKIDVSTWHSDFYKNDSPAGKYFVKNQEKLSDWQVYFFDGYHKQGGFGASTAQFLALYHFVNLIDNQFEEFTEIDLDNLLVEYWLCQSDAEKKIRRVLTDTKQMYLLPSGHDLIAQQHAGFSTVSKSLHSLAGGDTSQDVSESLSLQLEIQFRTFRWGFENLDFLLVPTGNKLATHTHIENLEKFSVEKLKEIQERLEGFFFIQDEVAFNLALKEWYQELQTLGFVSTLTQELVQKVETKPEILGIKGCGAMGSDVLFLTFNRSDREKVVSWLSSEKLTSHYGMEHLWKKPIALEGHSWD